jgi:hypothetical protein
MEDRSMRRVLAAAGLVAAVALAGCGGGRQATSTAPTTSPAPPETTACTGGDLGGDFSVVRGSAGAGQIVYRLALRNVSDERCFLGGIPDLRLLGGDGTALPTSVTPEQPGALAPVHVELAPGRSASATARFSPDVPGVGEGTTGPCEPIAAHLRVTPAGGGAVEVPVRPPTSVCEHGRLAFRALSASS